MWKKDDGPAAILHTPGQKLHTARTIDANDELTYLTAQSVTHTGVIQQCQCTRGMDGEGSVSQLVVRGGGNASQFCGPFHIETVVGVGDGLYTYVVDARSILLEPADTLPTTGYHLTSPHPSPSSPPRVVPAN